MVIYDSDSMCIYVVTTLRIVASEVVAWRSPAWFSQPGTAYESILSNHGDYHEGFYNYLVLEELTEGLYTQPVIRSWFRWDKEALPLEADQLWTGSWQSCDGKDFSSLRFVKSGGANPVRWPGQLLIHEDTAICQLG